jgi:hypothetical protein
MATVSISDELREKIEKAVKMGLVVVSITGLKEPLKLHYNKFFLIRIKKKGRL